MVVSVEFVNELLKNLGYENISITDNPIFFWDGESVSYSGTSVRKFIERYDFKKNETFLDFISKHKDKKIVLTPTYKGFLIEDNSINCYIHNKDKIDIDLLKNKVDELMKSLSNIHKSVKSDELDAYVDIFIQKSNEYANFLKSNMSK